MFNKMTEIINKLKTFSLVEHYQIQKVLRWVIFILGVTCVVLFYMDC